MAPVLDARFPENWNAKPGELVRIVMLDRPDRRPVEDIVWTDADYLTSFASAGLDVMEVHRPMGNDAGPFLWVSEQEVSPWAIYETGRRVQRDRAMSYVGGAEQPTLIINDLKAGTARGALALWIGRTEGYFSEMVVRSAP